MQHTFNFRQLTTFHNDLGYISPSRNYILQWQVFSLTDLFILLISIMGLNQKSYKTLYTAEHFSDSALLER